VKRLLYSERGGRTLLRRKLSRRTENYLTSKKKKNVRKREGGLQKDREKRSRTEQIWSTARHEGRRKPTLAKVNVEKGRTNFETKKGVSAFG